MKEKNIVRLKKTKREQIQNKENNELKNESIS